MKVFTAQFGKQNIQGVRADITIKTNKEPYNVFAPTWSLVMAHKKGLITDDIYTRRYYELMRYRWQSSKDRKLFMSIIKEPVLTLVCFCKSDKFCHRHLAKDILEKICQANKIDFEYSGEIE